MYRRVCVCIYTCECSCPRRPEVGAAVTGVPEPPDSGSGNLNSDPVEEQEAFLPIGPSL